MLSPPLSRLSFHTIGDPAMYHAQFTVRCLDPEEPIHPLSIAAVARMAHTARRAPPRAAREWEWDLEERRAVG